MRSLDEYENLIKRSDLTQQQLEGISNTAKKLKESTTSWLIKRRLGRIRNLVRKRGGVIREARIVRKMPSVAHIRMPQLGDVTPRSLRYGANFSAIAYLPWSVALDRDSGLRLTPGLLAEIAPGTYLTKTKYENEDEKTIRRRTDLTTLELMAGVPVSIFNRKGDEIGRLVFGVLHERYFTTTQIYDFETGGRSRIDGVDSQTSFLMQAAARWPLVDLKTFKLYVFEAGELALSEFKERLSARGTLTSALELDLSSSGIFPGGTSLVVGHKTEGRRNLATAKLEIRPRFGKFIPRIGVDVDFDPSGVTSGRKLRIGDFGIVGKVDLVF